jgi:hypothetical protein
MKVNLPLAAVLGIAAASVFTLPSQAATVFATTKKNIDKVSTVTPAAAYRIEGVSVSGVSGVSYNIDFDYGKYETLYSSGLPSLPGATSTTTDLQKATLANNLGVAILAALANPTALFVDGASETPTSITRLIDQLTSNPPPGTFADQVLNPFQIPFAQKPNPGGTTIENFVAICTVPGSTCDTTQSKNINDNLIYARFTEVPTTAVPTPALIPGLLGLGLAALRKKQQAEAVEA